MKQYQWWLFATVIFALCALISTFSGYYTMWIIFTVLVFISSYNCGRWWGIK